MTPADAAVSRRAALVDVLLSLGVMALGVAAAAVALSLPSAGGYSRVGPNVMPVVVSFGLILLGGLLLALSAVVALVLIRIGPSAAADEEDEAAPVHIG